MRRHRPAKTATVLVGAFALVMALGTSAFAQVPPTPELPEIPAPVEDAIGQAQGTVVPLMIQAADAAAPAFNGIGFGLRPACAGAGTAVVLSALLGASLPLPVSPGLVMTPVFLACGEAFSEGPVDPVLAQVDEAAGAPVGEALAPVTAQAAAAMAPVRPNLSEACGVASLFGSAEDQLPPPTNRLQLLPIICG